MKVKIEYDAEGGWNNVENKSEQEFSKGQA